MVHQQLGGIGLSSLLCMGVGVSTGALVVTCEIFASGYLKVCANVPLMIKDF